MRVMTCINTYLMCASALLALGQCGCYVEHWWTSFNHKGLSLCSNQRLIRGFYRSIRDSTDHIVRLEEAECCNVTSPWSAYAKQTTHIDWWGTMDVANSWSNCPSGYFLEGLYRTESNIGWLHNIEEGRCTKPRDHPYYYGHCYDQDISQCFNNVSLCKCNDSYFVTGLYHGGCDYLHCLDKLRCCKMAPNPQPLESVFQVKTRIMDMTMANLALLAHYLGYGWCGGCRSPYVGDDFYRTENSWRADQSRDCTGYKSDHRLGIDYGDWSYGVKDTKFATPVYELLLPESIDSGTFHNNDTNPATKVISLSETSIRTVTHRTSSSWKFYQELGININLSVLTASSKTSFEHSRATEESTGTQHSKTLQINTSKIIPANSSANWRLVLIKSRNTISYTATIIPRFSAELQGFLRWGGGYYGHNTNYHTDHRGSENRPTFNYRFGDASTPFYTALKQQSDGQSRPWLWNDIKSKYNNAQNLIDDLSDENNYLFTVSGQFEVVEGKHIELYWETGKPMTKRSTDHVSQEDDGNAVIKKLTQVAQAGPDDVPAPKLPPPEVKIDIERKLKVFPVALQGD